MSFEKWETYIFSDFVKINPPVKLVGSDVFSFVEMKDLNDGQRNVYPSTERSLTGGARFQNGDTLFARITPCLENGKICQVKGLKNEVGFGSTEFLVFRGKEGVSDNDFVYYLSRFEEVRRFAEQNMIGTSGRQRVGREAFDNLEMLLPPLATQRRIAALLTALDDKIELNRRMNETLEGIAGAVWGEWFGGYLAGEGLPEGWRVGTIGDLVFHSKESINPGKQPDTEFLHYSLPAFDNNQAPEKTLGQEILSNKYRVKKYSVLVSKLNPRIPRIWAIGDVKEETAICSTEFQVFVPKKDTYYSFVNLIFQQKEVLESMQTRASGTSSSHQRINPGDILSIEILIPTDDEIERFDKTVRDYFEMRFLSLHQSRTLTALRDALLPRLMSGKINV